MRLTPRASIQKNRSLRIAISLKLSRQPSTHDPSESRENSLLCRIKLSMRSTSLQPQTTFDVPAFDVPLEPGANLCNLEKTRRVDSFTHQCAITCTSI